MSYYGNPYGGFQPAAPDAAETLARRIDAAVAAISKDRVGVFLANIDRTRATAAVAIRVGDRVKILAEVRKPYDRQFEASAGVRVDLGLVHRAPPPPQRLTMSDYYDALRATREGLAPNSSARALVKALALRLGWGEPYLDGGRWFA